MDMAIGQGLFFGTTGKGIDRALNKRTHGRVEVLGSKSVRDNIDGNTKFWNFV